MNEKLSQYKSCAVSLLNTDDDDYDEYCKLFGKDNCI